MANLRKLLAAALTTGDLSCSDIAETALDRIAAMAFTDVLGAELWRVQLVHDPTAYRRALALLVKRTRHIAREPRLRTRLCDACLREWLETNCRTCGGRGMTLNEHHVQHVCPTCEGTALRRYSDQWRMRQLGFSLETYRKWERRFSAVHQKIANADAVVWRDIAQQLGRFGPAVEREMLAFHKERHILRSQLGGPAQNANNMPDYALSTATAAD